MAYDAGAIVARMTLDARKFRAEIGGAKEKLTGFEKAAKAARISMKAFAVTGAAITASMTAIAVASVKTAAKFENYSYQLRAVSKSTEEAVESMKMIRQFAERTPFATSQVVEAFVQLKAVGIDATKSVIETLGNVSFAMNRDIRDVASGLISFETEVLRRLGIEIDRTGKKAVIVSGDIRVETDKTAEAIRAGLLDVWERRFPNAMKDAEGTWRGLRAIAGSNIEELRADIGDALLPALKDLLSDSVIPIVEKMREWAKANQDLIESEFKTWLDRAWRGTEKLAKWAGKAATAIGTIADTLHLIELTQVEKTRRELSKVNDQILTLQESLKSEVGTVEEANKKWWEFWKIKKDHVGVNKVMTGVLKNLQERRRELAGQLERLLLLERKFSGSEEFIDFRRRLLGLIQVTTDALGDQGDATDDVAEKMKALDLRFAALNSMMRTNHSIAAELSPNLEALQIQWQALHDMGRDANKAIVEGMQEQDGLLQKLNEDVQRVADGFTYGLGQGIADMVISGRNFGDVMKAVFRAMVADIAKTVAELLIMEKVLLGIKALMSSIGGPFGWLGSLFHEGGLVMHEGGLVAPRVTMPEIAVPKPAIKAHSGLTLSGDEVPIIAQRGEGILSKDRGMPAIGGPAALALANLGIPPAPAVHVHIDTMIADDDWVDDFLIPKIRDAARRDIGIQTTFSRY
jgi:hypothetical protein